MFKSQSLTPEILHIVRDKGTELPFSHEYQALQQGSYLCRQCGLGLFRGNNQFHSGCGWPSFDATIDAAVKQVQDEDGRRIEIQCSRCNAHLGHVFYGEHSTLRNIRHCVNGLSLDFVADVNVTDSEEAIFAAGCFWGVEYYFRQLPGVLKTEVGYSGGHIDYPTYEDVCQNSTGHYEVIRVVYDPQTISYEEVCKYFFEIHDPYQVNGQGPDLGTQYLSRIFYYDAGQKAIASKLIEYLNVQGQVITHILPVAIFWPAEAYHQNYYVKTGKNPYCHHYQKRFYAH